MGDQQPQQAQQAQQEKPRTLEELLDTNQFEEVRIVSQNQKCSWKNADRFFRSLLPVNYAPNQFAVYGHVASRRGVVTYALHNPSDNRLYGPNPYNVSADGPHDLFYWVTMGDLHYVRITSQYTEIFHDAVAKGLLATIDPAVAPSQYVLK